MLILFYLYQKISGMITVSAAMLNLCITIFVSVLLMCSSYLYGHHLLNILED